MDANSNDDIREFLHDTCCPRGHQYTLVLISLTKRILKEEMPASYRLQFLEHLEKIGDKWLTAEMVASIEPVCDKGYEIIREVQKLGANKALDVYAKHFKTFATLNPSLLSALEQSPAYQHRLMTTDASLMTTNQEK
jgi:hypothetical protein